MIPYIIKSFRGGVSDQSDKGIAGSFKYAHGIDIHDRDDVLVCNYRMTTETSTSGLVKFMVPSTDGTLYAFCANGSIYARTSTGTWNFAYNDENGAIKGAAEWSLSDGSRYLVWATDTAVARMQINGSPDLPWAGVNAAWKTEYVQSGLYHVMRQASGQLMIANKDYIAKVDYDGNFDPLKLNIRPGNIIKCFEERGDYVVLGSERGTLDEEGHIWSWIISALKWVQKTRIPAFGVNALISTEAPLCQAGTDGEIFPADFTNSVPIAAIPGGGQVNPDGVTVINDLAAFGFYGGTYPGIWTYGRRNKNRPLSLSYGYRLARTVFGSTVSEIGSLSTVNGAVLASWKTSDGTTVEYGVDVDEAACDSGVYEALEFDGELPHQRKLFDAVKVTFTPLIDGCAIACKFKMDKQSAWRYAVLGNGTTTFTQADTTEAIFNIGEPAKIIEVGLELTPSGLASPEIQSVVTYVSEQPNEY